MMIMSYLTGDPFTANASTSSNACKVRILHHALIRIGYFSCRHSLRESRVPWL